MAKQLKKEGLTVNKIYLGILMAVTAIFVVALVLVLFNVFEYKEFSSLKELQAETFTNQKVEGANSYYVLVYDKDNAENELIEEKVLEYANYAKNKEGASPIFILEYTSANASIIQNKLTSSFNVNTDLPCLVTISNGSVTNPKKTVSSILQLLEDEMNK